VQHCFCKMLACIRHRLALEFPRREIGDLKTANVAGKRTVFTVQASEIGEFLAGWNLPPLNTWSGHKTRDLAGQ
jgi:hypothetical protein